MLLGELVRRLDNITQVENQYDWDNSGLIIGNLEHDIRNILLTLEITPSVVKEAEQKNVQMIISHHPIIFSGRKKFISGEGMENMVYHLIQNGIDVYAAHTNFDMLQGGLNDFFLDCFGIKDRNYLYDEEGKTIGRTFCLKKPTKITAVAKELKRKFVLPEIRLICREDKEISNIGIVTGSGIDVLFEEDHKDIELFITGDVKYHQAQDILQGNKAVIDAGHFGTEQIFPKAFLSLVQKEILGVNMILSDVNVNPFRYIE